MVPSSQRLLREQETLLHDVEEELHDLCQPLTALYFHLELGKFAKDAKALRAAVDGGLEETARMIDSVRRMRERVATMKAAQKAGKSTGGLQPSIQPIKSEARN